MTNKYMKNCPTSLTSREMQTSATLKFCLMSMKMTTMKKEETANVGKDLSKGGMKF